MSNNLAKLVIFKPKKVYKHLCEDYQRRIEEKYGENILRHVIQTQDFAFPSEDYTGQLNETVAKKTREMIQVHAEMLGKEEMECEEVKIIEDIGENGKKRRKKKNMEKYAPLIFEECYVRQKAGMTKVQNSFELMSEKADPARSLREEYKGTHLFVMCHGFQGTSFDMRMFKNIISIAMPDAQFLCSQANEDSTEGNIFDMGYKLA